MDEKKDEDIKLKDTIKSEGSTIKKNHKNIYVINLIAIIVTVIIAMAMIGFYSKIDNVAINRVDEKLKSNLEFYVTNKEFSEILSKETFVLYKDMLETIQGSEVNASDIYLKPKSEFDNSDDYNIFKDKLNSNLEDWKKDFESDYINLDYSILDKDENIIKSSNDNNLGTLINSNDANVLKNKYSFYVSIKFDDNGELSVNDIYIENQSSSLDYKRSIRNDLLYYKLRKMIYLNNNDVFNPIKNMTFIYGINKDLKYYDKIKINLNGNIEDNAYNGIGHMYVLMFSAIIIILSLLIPFKFENKIRICKMFFKVPFELSVILISIIISFMYSEAPVLIRNTIDESTVKFLLSDILKIDPLIGSFLDYLFNLLYWAVYIILIVTSITILKNILFVGLIKYCKEKTLISIIVRFVKRISKATHKKLLNIIKNVDLKDKSNNFIKKVLLVNLLIQIILSIICILVGEIIISSVQSLFIWLTCLLIIYNIILFKMIKKYFDIVRDDFNILLNGTSKIADGNLEAKINEDVGIFNPIKDLIERIKVGFKKAVDEEVKSQKMKTDLISNVSHDLKTPLTSIITYVDLLKNENISAEDRRAYIETLDKKSQRLKFLIEDLFEVSKATSGNITLNLVKVDIVGLMKQTQIELEDKIRASDLQIKNNFPENKVILELDSQKTFRVFENLLTNIVKYAMTSSRVYIDIIEEKEQVVVTMKNMSAEEITFISADIVERFQRGDKSRNTEGSGIGLAIVKSFVEAQGGKFNIDIDGDLFKAIIIFKK